MMILTRLQGGLGNQMFQYAFGRSLSIKHNSELLLDITALKNKSKNSTQRAFELSIFPIKARIATQLEIRKVKPLYLKMINTISFKLGLGGIQMSRYFIENGFSFNSTVSKISDNCYVSGYWQSPKYFNSFDEILRSEFQFKSITDYNNLKILERIKNTNSVSIHIRKTDYVNKPNNVHYNCDISYYKNAIDCLLKSISNPHFFIFSDDIDWVKRNIGFKTNLEYITNNIKDSSYKDMFLMSQCNHNIIANSSFSWWGAYLNSNKSKIVIAPKRWFSDENLNNQTSELILDAWIRK